MKKSLLLSFFCAFNLQAADQVVTWSASTGVKSEYLARIGVTLSKSPISVNIVEADWKDCYVGIWNATSLSGQQYGSTYGDEWDLYGGWAHTFGPVRLDLSGSYFALSELDKTSDDMWIAEQEISLPKLPFLQPYVRSTYFGSVEPYWKPGWFVFAGVRKSVSFGHSFADRPFSLNLEASAAYDFGALHDYNGFVYYRFTTGLDIPLSKHATVSPDLIYQIPALGERSDPQGFTDSNRLVYGLTFKWAF